MAAVFLSYSSQDRERVALLAETLRAEGFEVWWDREIPVAVTYEDYIRRQLDSAEAVVVVWSQASVLSRYVRWEAQRAERRRGVLVPVMIEEADLPPEYFLVQSADLTRWQGDRTDREWRRLVAALVRLVGEPVRAGAAEVQPPPEMPSAEVAPVVMLEASPPPREAVEALPVVEAAAVAEEAATFPVVSEEGTTLEVPAASEEAVRVLERAETEPDGVEPVAGREAEEIVEEGGTGAQTKRDESLPVWEPVPEEALMEAGSIGEAPGKARRAETDEPRRPPWYRRRWVLVTAAGLLAVFAVLAVVVRLRGGGEETATTLPASTTPAVTTSQGPTTTSTATSTTAVIPTTVPVADLNWARVSADQVGEACFGCAALGDLLVRVGFDETGNVDAAAWTRAEGQDWERVPHDDGVFGGPGKQVMSAVAAGGPGLVAVGYAEGADGKLGGAAVWTSADGFTWERVAHDEGVFGGEGMREMTGVAAFGPGLVAVGVERPAGGDGEADGAVWTSADGRTWVRVPDDAGVFGGIGNQEMYAVAVGGPGLVAVGYDDSADWFDPSSRGWDAAVWVSADGAAWERVPDLDGALSDPTSPSKQAMYGVVAWGPGLVAVGADESGGDFDGAVWASVDGLTWARVPHDESVFGGSGHQLIEQVAVLADGSGLAALGKDWTAGVELIWVSPPLPGLEWARVAEVSVDVCPGCAVLGEVEVMVSCRDEGQDVLPISKVLTRRVGLLSWHEQLDYSAVFNGACTYGVVAGGPGLVAFGGIGWAADRDAAVWTSIDGLTWERVPDDQAVLAFEGTQEIRGMVAGGPGLVAVGYDHSGGHFDGAVWTSTDGLTWTRVPHDEVAFGGGDLWAVVTGGPGLVAVGKDNSLGGDAAVWTSPDGLTWNRVPHDEAVFGCPGGCDVRAVVAGGPGLVAVGNDDPAGDRDAVVWWSADGLAWHRVPHDEAVFGGPETQEMDWAVAWQGGLVAGGWGDDTTGAYWISPPPG